MGGVVTGRILVIVGFALLIVTLVPFLGALILAAFTGGTEYALFPLLALVVTLGPYAIIALAAAGILSVVGIVLGGNRVLGLVTAIVAGVLAVGLTVWVLL